MLSVFFANTGLYIIQQEPKDSYTTRTFSTQQSTAVQMISESVTLIGVGVCATKLVLGGGGGYKFEKLFGILITHLLSVQDVVTHFIL